MIIDVTWEQKVIQVGMHNINEARFERIFNQNFFNLGLPTRFLKQCDFKVLGKIGMLQLIFPKFY